MRWQNSFVSWLWQIANFQKKPRRMGNVYNGEVVRLVPNWCFCEIFFHETINFSHVNFIKNENGIIWFNWLAIQRIAGVIPYNIFNMQHWSKLYTRPWSHLVLRDFIIIEAEGKEEEENFTKKEKNDIAIAKIMM